MLFAKKIKHILLLVFLVITLASCDKECYEADQFYRKVKTIYANGIDANNRPERQRFGSYNDEHGGEVIEWKDTGMVASGDYFVIAVSGGWRDVGGRISPHQKFQKKIPADFVLKIDQLQKQIIVYVDQSLMMENLIMMIILS